MLVNLVRNVPRPPGAWLVVDYHGDFISPWVYMEVLANADKAGIVVIAVLDIAHQWRQIVEVGTLRCCDTATPGSSLAATSCAARAVLSKERNSTPSNFSKKWLHWPNA